MSVVMVPWDSITTDDWLGRGGFSGGVFKGLLVMASVVFLNKEFGSNLGNESLCSFSAEGLALYRTMQDPWAKAIDASNIDIAQKEKKIQQTVFPGLLVKCVR